MSLSWIWHKLCWIALRRSNCILQLHVRLTHFVYQSSQLSPCFSGLWAHVNKCMRWPNTFCMVSLMYSISQHRLDNVQLLFCLLVCHVGIKLNTKVFSNCLKKDIYIFLNIYVYSQIDHTSFMCKLQIENQKEFLILRNQNIAEQCFWCSLLYSKIIYSTI